MHDMWCRAPALENPGEIDRGDANDGGREMGEPTISPSAFDALGPETVMNIALALPYHDLVTLDQTSRSMRALLDDEYFCKRYYNGAVPDFLRWDAPAPGTTWCGMIRNLPKVVRNITTLRQAFDTWDRCQQYRFTTGATGKLNFRTYSQLGCSCCIVIPLRDPQSPYRLNISRDGERFTIDLTLERGEDGGKSLLKRWGESAINFRRVLVAIVLSDGGVLTWELDDAKTTGLGWLPVLREVSLGAL